VSGPLQPLRADLPPEAKDLWRRVLEAGVKAQRLVTGAVTVGDTAAALFAGHRVSMYTDHLLSGLKSGFDEVLARLAASPDWKTARIDRPVLILGSIDEIQVGFRQSRRTLPMESTRIRTPCGELTVATLDELIGMKAYLAYERRATRDFLDFAALADSAGHDVVLASLLRLDHRYGELQTVSVALEVAKTLAQPSPVDLDQTDLRAYKSLIPRWHDWQAVAEVCRRYGLLLGEKLVLDAEG